MAARKNDAATGKPRNVVAEARGTERKKPSAPSARWESIKSLLGALLIFLFVRTFLVEAYRIPSGSMIPSMLVGDWLFVNKLVYGPHVPFTNVTLPGYSEPARGDIAVFRSPYQIDQPWDPHPTLVKRIAGVPGDTLFMRDDLLHVNGVPMPQTGEELLNPSGASDYYDPLFEWQRPYEIHGSRFGDPPERPTVGTWGPLLVPELRYMMLGDNRHASKDGRYWGFVPRENFRGRPLFVYYSYRTSAESDRALPFITDIRWYRIGHRIR